MHRCMLVPQEDVGRVREYTLCNSIASYHVQHMVDRCTPRSHLLLVDGEVVSSVMQRTVRQMKARQLMCGRQVVSNEVGCNNMPGQQSNNIIKHP